MDRLSKRTSLENKSVHALTRIAKIISDYAEDPEIQELLGEGSKPEESAEDAEKSRCISFDELVGRIEQSSGFDRRTVMTVLCAEQMVLRNLV